MIKFSIFLEDNERKKKKADEKITNENKVNIYFHNSYKIAYRRKRCRTS